MIGVGSVARGWHVGLRMDGAGELFESLGETWPGNQVLISMNDDSHVGC